jgi:hypothetical protein
VSAIEDEDQLVFVELIVHHDDLLHAVDVLIEHILQFLEQRRAEPRQKYIKIKYFSIWSLFSLI